MRQDEAKEGTWDNKVKEKESKVSGPILYFFNCLFASLNLNILFYREAILDSINTGKPQNNNQNRHSICSRNLWAVVAQYSLK